jgi:hypothetical protein
MCRCEKLVKLHLSTIHGQLLLSARTACFCSLHNDHQLSRCLPWNCLREQEISAADMVEEGALLI